ncbi:MAG: hypothetical protein H5T69_00325 [Chloroflexi bacterium]|nr:hypothetical protein [Chloroflexota bacterium]
MFRSSKSAQAGDELRVEQLSIRDGNWRRQAPELYTLPAGGRRGASNRGDLYLVIEVPRSITPPAGLYGELAQVVADTYLNMSRSITRGLREALLAANTFLFEHNLRADSEHQVVAGLNAVVIRDQDVYMAQLGPSLVTHIHEGQATRYPADSIWLRSENPGTFDLSRQPPAGLRRDVEPDLAHVTLLPGDVLILSTTDLARLASRRELAEALTYDGKKSPRMAVEALVNGRNVSAIVIDWPSERSPEMESSDAAAKIAPSQTTRPKAAAPSPPPSGAPTHEPTPEPRRGPMTVSEPFPSPMAPSPEEAEEYVQEEEQTLLEEDYLEEPEIAETDDDYADEVYPAEPRIGRTSSAPVGGEGQSKRQRSLADLRRNLSTGAENLRHATEDALLRVLPEEAPPRPAPAPRSAEAGISLSGKALVLVALILPLIMLALVIMTRIQYERTRVEQFNSLQALAQAQYDNALKMPSDSETRRELEEALRTVRDGLAIDANDEALLALERRIRHKMEEIDRVELLHHVWKLRDLDDAPISPTDSSRIVVHGIDVFVLNRGSSRVYKFLLNDARDALLSADTAPLLMQKGEMRGGIKLSDIVDIAWLEAGGDRTLSTFVAVERTGFLLAYDPQQGIDVLPVADSDMWLKPDAIGGYYGNLYVLDPLLNRILKYVPHENAYTVPPTDYLPPQLNVDLTGAVDMTIDGNIYVLFADGQVKKFFQGEPQPFTLQGLPSPMRSPTVIFVSGPQEPDAYGYVYIGDTGNERILQFDKAGAYLRQFKVPAGQENLKQLRGLYVDEENQRLFFLSGKTLWMASLPALRR